MAYTQKMLYYGGGLVPAFFTPMPLSEIIVTYSKIPFIAGPGRDFKNDMVQNNPTYDNCTPKQSPTGQETTENLMLPGIRDRAREYCTFPTLDKDINYKEIPCEFHKV